MITVIKTASTAPPQYSATARTTLSTNVSIASPHQFARLFVDRGIDGARVGDAVPLEIAKRFLHDRLRRIEHRLAYLGRELDHLDLAAGARGLERLVRPIVEDLRCLQAHRLAGVLVEHGLLRCAERRIALLVHDATARIEQTRHADAGEL